MTDTTDFVKTDELIDDLLKDLNLPADTINVVKNIYTVSSFKNVLEMLFLFRGKDPEFVKDLVTFIKTQTDQIPADQVEIMSSNLEKESAKLINDLITKLAEDLNPDQKRKLYSNIISI